MNPELLENIESFLDGEITREELEVRLSSEEITELDEQIEWFRKNKLAIEAVGLRQQLQDILPQVEEEETVNETKVVSIRRNYQQVYWIAASFIVLTVAFFGIYSGNQTSLYEQHLYQDPGLPVLMSQSDKYELYDAMSYYSEGNYEVAAQKLKGLQEASGSTDTTNYYLGASLLYQEKANEAIPYLDKVQALEASAFKEKAEWMLIMAYLQVENLEEVKGRLAGVLSNSNHTFYSQAQALSKDIN